MVNCNKSKVSHHCHFLKSDFICFCFVKVYYVIVWSRIYRVFLDGECLQDSGLWDPLFRDCWIYKQVCVWFCSVLAGLTLILWLCWVLKTELTAVKAVWCLMEAINQNQTEPEYLTLDQPT